MTTNGLHYNIFTVVVGDVNFKINSLQLQNWFLSKGDSLRAVANARFTPNRDQLRADLRVEKFWISWTVVKLLSTDRKLAVTSKSGATDIRVNKKCIICPVIRVTCDRTTTDLRARDPRTPFLSLSA